MCVLECVCSIRAKKGRPPTTPERTGERYARGAEPNQLINSCYCVQESSAVAKERAKDSESVRGWLTLKEVGELVTGDWTRDEVTG